MTQIGRYEIVRKTGNHGLDALYEAFDPVMQRTVTIRMPERTTDSGTAPQSDHPSFNAHPLADLDHPNIVRILSREEADDVPYLVLEQTEGTPLSQLLSERRTLPASRVVSLLKGASSALDHVHKKGLVHGNLSSAGLLVGEDGLLKVRGFEIARPVEAFYSSTTAIDLDTVMETVPYMSPEILQGDPVDGRADQFSLACIAVRALTGVMPFPATSPVALIRQVLLDNPDLRTAAGQKLQVPLGVAKVLERGLAKSPAARFPSCGEFVAALETASAPPAASHPTRYASVEQPPTSPAALRQPVSRSVWMIAAAGVILTALILYLALRTPAAKAPQAVTPPVQAAPVSSAPPQSAPAKAASETPPTAAPTRAVARQSRKKAVETVEAAAKDTTQKDATATSLKPVEPKVIRP